MAQRRAGQVVAVQDLKLGDVIQLQGIDAFGTAIVKQVGTHIVAERPYMSAAPFNCKDRRIVYIGHEDVHLNSGTVIFLYASPPRNDD